MFKSVTVFIALLACGAQAQEPTSDAGRDVRAAIKNIQDAIARKDRSALERMLAPDFTAIDRQGTVRNRTLWIDAVMAGGLLTQKVDSPEQFSEELGVHGTTAATRTSVNRYRELSRQRDISTLTRAIYVRLDGEWRWISTQESQLHDGPIVNDSFDAAVGTYELANGRRFVVTKVGRTFFGQLPVPGVAKVPLFETPNGGFVGPGGEFVYTLEKDGNGRVTSVTMTRYGTRVWHAKRVE